MLRIHWLLMLLGPFADPCILLPSSLKIFLFGYSLRHESVRSSEQTASWMNAEVDVNILGRRVDGVSSSNADARNSSADPLIFY